MDYEKEIHRLKVKCNTYAERLVGEGFDDVEWEATNGPYSLFATLASRIDALEAKLAPKDNAEDLFIVWGYGMLPGFVSSPASHWPHVIPVPASWVEDMKRLKVPPFDKE